MNIHCKWKGDVLELYRTEYHWIEMIYADSITKEPVLSIGMEETLTFTEIEHIMDCWENQSK